MTMPSVQRSPTPIRLRLQRHPLLLSVVLAGATISVAGATPLDFEPAITVGSGADAYDNTSMAASRDWVYSVWREEEGTVSRIQLARSTDAGRTFESPVSLRAVPSADVDLRFTDVAASGNHVTVVWTESTSSGSTRLQLRTSDDHGESFSSVEDVDGGADFSNSRQPRLVFDDNRLYLLFAGDTGSGYDLLLRTSTDFGDSLSSIEHMNTGGFTHFGIAAAGQSVYVAWSGGIGLFLRRSYDGGETFFGAQTLAGSEFWPALATVGDSVYLVSFKEANTSTVVPPGGDTPYDVHFRSSYNRGISFSSPTVLNASTSVNRFSAIVALPGLVSVAWLQGVDDIRFRSSYDNGGTFESATTIGSSTVTPDLATRGLQVIAAWSDSNATRTRARRSSPKPVVFVPGVAGSVLYDQANDRELWPGVGSTHHGDLSLHPEDDPDQFDIVATRPIRAGAEFQGFEIKPIYGPFVDYLTNDIGLHLYETTNESGTFVPSRLTEAGCDVIQGVDAPTPELFLFPYDWRRDNAHNADRLRDYLGCVRSFHPEREVNTVTHSMGSLLARRSILDQSAADRPKRLITIGAPWLGAPKMYNVLDTGAFGVYHVLDSTIKHILGSFDGAHQLIPSRVYTATLAVLPPLVEDGRDLDGDGVDDETFTHDRLIEVADAVYGSSFTPGSTGETFHGNPGQDDWSFDTTSVGYFHIYGEQHGSLTIGQVRAQNFTYCKFGFVLCNTIPITKLELTRGDGTVPTLSAVRRHGGTDLNHPDATLWPVISSSEDEDEGSEHNGMMRNPIVHNKVIEYLFANTDVTASPQRLEKSESGPATLVPLHQLLIAGAQSVLLRDQSNNELILYTDQILGEIPGVVSFRLGVGVSMVAFPTTDSRTFTVHVLTGTDPMAIQLITGTDDNVTRAIRYIDLDLVAGRSAMLTISGNSVSDLTYDSTGDGVLDATITPTVDVTGEEAADTEPPMITVDQTTSAHGGGHVTLAIEAIGAVSGPALAYSSFDGALYQAVTEPIDVDPQMTSEIWVLADDALGNRATRRVPIIDPDLVFADGFESGTDEAWSQP